MISWIPVWISGVILLFFALWYFQWQREQVLNDIRGIVRDIVMAHNLEHPDEKILGFNIVFNEKEKNASGLWKVIRTAIQILMILLIAVALVYWMRQRGAG